MHLRISFLAVLALGVAAVSAPASTVVHSTWAKDDELDVTVKQSCPAEPVSLFYRITFPNGRSLTESKGRPFADPCRGTWEHEVELRNLGLEWEFWTGDRAHREGAQHLANRRFSGLYLKTEKHPVKVYVAVVSGGERLMERWATLRPKKK